MKRAISLGLLSGPALLLLGALACSPTKAGGNGGSGGGTTNTTTSQTGGDATTSGDGGQGAGGEGGLGGFGGGMTTGTGTGGVINCVHGGDNDDVDMDGFTPAQGDCEDCDPDRNPDAIEVPTPKGGTPYDEDCDGKIDEDDTVLCDDSLAVDAADPLAAPHAIEICKTSMGDKDWGITTAKWVLADGTEPQAFDLQNFHLGHGMLTGFGPNVAPQAGKRLLALSSGTARQPKDPGYQSVNGFSKGYTCGQPMGFPKESPACPGVVTGEPHDAAGVEIKLRPPSNAKGFSFDFKFQTFEWPGFVCSQYNDFFIAILSPIPKGQSDGNIAFDKMGNPVSVNNAFIEVCGCQGNPPNPCFAGGKTFACPLGDFDLIGTGFGFDMCAGCEDHGGTGWLRTAAPIEKKYEEITLRFAVYDSGDGVLDTTTLIDNFQWIARPGVTVGTDEVPK
jgi:hypothetical protein